MDDDYIVRMIQFTGDIHGAVRVDNDGFASIYINDDLSREARQRAFRHARLSPHSRREHRS